MAAAKKYNLILRQSLSNGQEDMLVREIQAYLRDMEESLKQIRGGFSGSIPAKLALRATDKAARETIMAKIDGLLAPHDGKPMFMSYYILEKKDGRHYVFTAPNPNDLYGIEPIVKALSPLAGGKKDMMLEFLRRVMKEISVGNSEYKIEVADG